MTVTRTDFAARCANSLNQRRVKVRMLSYATSLIALLSHIGHLRLVHWLPAILQRLLLISLQLTCHTKHLSGSTSRIRCSGLSW